MTYKKFCSVCEINFTTNKDLLYFRCFNCREKLPIGESINNNEMLFNNYRYSSNNLKDSSKIWLYSQAKLLWNCEYNHEFRQTPKNILNGYKCKQCLPGKIFKNSDSLQVNFPELSKEWDYGRNIFAPSDYSFGSGVKVWWLCGKYSHGWMASIKSRTNKSHGNGCRKCAELSYRSNGEIELFKYIEGIYSGNIIANTKSIIENMELDIYLPELNIAIEYNGSYWHGDENLVGKYNKTSLQYHYEKYFKCLSKNIELFYVWEEDWLKNNNLIKELLLSIVAEGEGPSNLSLLHKTAQSYNVLQKFQ